MRNKVMDYRVGDLIFVDYLIQYVVSKLSWITQKLSLLLSKMCPGQENPINDSPIGQKL